MKKSLFSLLCGLTGIVVLVGCSGANSDSEFTLPIVNSIPVSVVATATSSPFPVSEELYTIQIGDTLFEIAQSFGVTVEDLISYNGIADPDAIAAGQILKVPSPANPSGTTTPTTIAP